VCTVDVMFVRYQAPRASGTFWEAEAGAADKMAQETRPRRQRRHYLSADVRSKYADFPLIESKRDRLKQREKQQQIDKKTAFKAADKSELSSSSSVVNVCRTGDAEEKMDVLQ